MPKNAFSKYALLLALVAMLVPALALAETAKARVLEVDQKKNEVKVDVAGQPRTYHVINRELSTSMPASSAPQHADVSSSSAPRSAPGECGWCGKCSPRA